MNTAGLEAVLVALKADSAPTSAEKAGAAEGEAFNAAFDAAARDAGEAAPVQSAAHASMSESSKVYPSQQAGKALPDNGKELPNPENFNVAGAVTPEDIAADAMSMGALTPSPFMKAALDKAAAVTSTPVSPSSALPLANSPSEAPQSPHQDLIGASRKPLVGSVNTAAAHTPPLKPQSDPVDGDNLMAGNLRSKSANTGSMVGATSPPINQAAPSTPASPGETLRQKDALSELNYSAEQRYSRPIRIPQANSTAAIPMPEADAQLRRTEGGSGITAVAGTTPLGTAAASNNPSAEFASTLAGDALDVVLDSSAARAGGPRDGRSFHTEGAARAPDTLINPGLGVASSSRSAELTTVTAATQMTSFKASPDAADFPQEVIAKVRMIQGQGNTEARLNLHPAELGRLQIAITSEGDATRVAFVVDNAQAKEALEQAMPRLREFLQQAGLQLAEGSVSQQGHQGGAALAQNDAGANVMNGPDRSGDDEDGVLANAPDQGADPNRILGAYA